MGRALTRLTSPSAMVWLFAGFTVWMLSFASLYGLHALGCALGWHQVQIGPVEANRAALAAVWGLHVAAIALLLSGALRVSRRNRDGGGLACFMRAVAPAVTAAALFATVWTGLPVLLYRSCIGADISAGVWTWSALGL